MTQVIINRRKVSHAELIAALRERDGDICEYPGCHREIDFSLEDGPLMPTLDHREPQSWCREQGWAEEDIWSLDNLQIFHRKCNAAKGSRRYINGVLEPKPINKFKYRRQKRAERPEICQSCNAGRDLGPDEVCASCNSGPMPERFPRWARVKTTECDHELFWCAWCSIGVIPRVSSVSVALLQGESGEWE